MSRDILKKLSRYNYRSFLKGRFSFKLRWEHVVIAFLLGLLMVRGGGSGHLIRDTYKGISPAPAIITLKTLPLMKEPPIPAQTSLETVFISKLRDYGTYPNSFYDSQCTQYVASRLPVTWSGNANEWAANAAAQGYKVSAVPDVGTIATNTTDSYLGHVAIVGEVANGMVRLEEQNYEGPGVISTDRWAPISMYEYIYV